MAGMGMILAPLRGVTTRCFRDVFAEVIVDCAFGEAFTPFIAANAGVDPGRSAELSSIPRSPSSRLSVTPQFIGKDPSALRSCLERVREMGYLTADLNCGCPYPMVRNKGRGSGMLRTPHVLERMLAVGCEVMGEGRFSVKARLGVDRNDELLSLMPLLNSFPLRFLTVHPRSARQMYGGECDWEAFRRIESAAKMPLVRNGDIPFPSLGPAEDHVMIGRGFVRWLGGRGDICALLARYVDASCAELSGDRAVLGRMKELVSYWKDLPQWRKAWPAVKISRTVEEFRLACGMRDAGR